MKNRTNTEELNIVQQQQQKIQKGTLKQLIMIKKCEKIYP